MTEHEWLTAADPREMWMEVRSHRKRRLLVAACCRRVWELLSPVGRAAVETVERFAGGDATEADLIGFLDQPGRAFTIHQTFDPSDPLVMKQWELGAGLDYAVEASLDLPGCRCHRCGHEMGAGLAAKGVIWDCDVCNVSRWPLTRAPEFVCRTVHLLDPGRPESAAQAALFRCVAGNPFRPVAFDPAWRTDTAVSLAKGVYESRDFSPMPILADALQDAGCEDADVLSHCRDPQQVHVRGCWVVDLVLGKT